MKQFSRSSQRGAVLVIALVMLLVLTVLAVSNMRGVTLESRITSQRALSFKLNSAAEAALREAEFRFYGPGNLVDKLEPNANNCKASNVLVATGLNKPCLLSVQKTKLAEFVLAPQTLTSSNQSTFLESGFNSGGPLPWMTYKGLDAADASVADFSAVWNSVLASGSGSAVNAEYGMAAQGQGTYFYLVNGRADGRLTLQSTIANIYLGLNN